MARPPLNGPMQRHSRAPGAPKSRDATPGLLATVIRYSCEGRPLNLFPLRSRGKIEMGGPAIGRRILSREMGPVNAALLISEPSSGGRLRWGAPLQGNRILVSDGVERGKIQMGLPSNSEKRALTFASKYGSIHRTGGIRLALNPSILSAFRGKEFSTGRPEQRRLDMRSIGLSALAGLLAVALFTVAIACGGAEETEAEPAAPAIDTAALSDGRRGGRRLAGCACRRSAGCAAAGVGSGDTANGGDCDCSRRS